MVNELRPLRVNAIELLRQPGTERPVDAAIPAEPLGVVHERLDGDIGVALVLASMNDGGLCPACGINLNTTSCECDTTVTDHRWSALDGLVLDDS